MDTDKPFLLNVSFSGGRTSAVMTDLLLKDFRHLNPLITFANTGCEHPATLDFVHRCEQRWGYPIRWVEATVDPRPGRGIGFKEVSYETAARDGEPFEAAVAKYGIYNQTNPSCTARLKTDPMQRFLAAQGYYRGKNLNYTTAIGIRADEMDRMSSRAEENRFWYPLVERGITKRDVALHIKDWGFDLEIPHDAYGNCVWCWKKSMRKHMTLALEDPGVFDFPRRMEQEYGTVNGHTKAAVNGRKWWFRGHLSADDIIARAHSVSFERYQDDPYDHGIDFDPDLDLGSGSCGESCEVYADE